MGKYLRQLRKDKGLSQRDMADRLDVSRPTYIQIEADNRELTLKEAKMLAEFFNLSLEDFYDQKMPTEIKVVAIRDKKKLTVKEERLRINVPQKNLKKFKEVLLYILGKIGNKPNVGMTVIYKLLYFIDFNYYEKFEEQLIGATYIKNNYGPTPVEFKKIVDEMKKKNEIEEIKSLHYKYPQTKYLPLRKEDLSMLMAREKDHIDEVLVQFGDKSATWLSNYSHKDVPWITTEVNKPIDYEAVFYRTDETSVRAYDEDGMDS